MLNDTDRARITAAITEAETKTSGEVFCVLASEGRATAKSALLWAAVLVCRAAAAVMAGGCTVALARSSPAGP